MLRREYQNWLLLRGVCGIFDLVAGARGIVLCHVGNNITVLCLAVSHINVGTTPFEVAVIVLAWVGIAMFFPVMPSNALRLCIPFAANIAPI